MSKYIYIILSSFLKNIFIGYRINDGFFLFNTSNCCSIVFWSSVFVMRKQLLFILFFSTLCSFENFSLNWFHMFSYLCLGIIFFVFMLLEIGFLNLWVDVLHQFWNFLGHIRFKIFLLHYSLYFASGTPIIYLLELSILSHRVQMVCSFF